MFGRSLSLIVLLLPVAGSVSGVEPARPAYQRLLSGDDAKKADDLEKRANKLARERMFAEAIKEQEELIAFRRARQGADHWQVVSEVRWVENIKTLSTLPLPVWEAYQSSFERTKLTGEFRKKREYEKELTIWKEDVEACRRAFGDKNLRTAYSLYNLGGTLNAIGRYNEAIDPLQKSLTIHMAAYGKEHPQTIDALRAVANNLRDSGKFGDARVMFQEVAALCRTVYGPNDPEIARCLKDIGIDYSRAGMFPAAAAAYEQALAILAERGGDVDVKDITRVSLAATYTAMNRLADAQKLYESILKVRQERFGADSAEAARIYSHMAIICSKQHRQADAAALHEKAFTLTRARLGEENPETARVMAEYATSLSESGKEDEAVPLHERALAIRRKVLGENHPQTAYSYNSLGEVLRRQGRLEEAGEAYAKAVAIHSKAQGPDHPQTATVVSNLANNLSGRGKFDEAAVHYVAAVSTFRRIFGESHPQTLKALCFQAVNLRLQRKYREAIETLQQAARSYEMARLLGGARGVERMGFGDRSPYTFLALSLIRQKQPLPAWDALEAGLCRGLLDELAVQAPLSADEKRRQADLQWRLGEVQAEISPLVAQGQLPPTSQERLEKLVQTRTALFDQLSDLAAVVSRRQVSTLAEVQSALSPDAAIVSWTEIPLLGFWACVVRSKGDPVWVHLPGSGTNGVREHVDRVLPNRFHRWAAGISNGDDAAAIRQQLFAQWMAPLKPALQGASRLFVVSSARESFPVELLAEGYTVSYAPSATYIVRIKNRPAVAGTELLALGDPIFPKSNRLATPPDLPPNGAVVVTVRANSPAAKLNLRAGDVIVKYGGVTVDSFEQLLHLMDEGKDGAEVDVSMWRPNSNGTLIQRKFPPGRLGNSFDRRPAREAYAARTSGDGGLPELPGTRVEVARIAKLFDGQATVWTDADASESRLEAARRDGQLARYRFLHFATHGLAGKEAFQGSLYLAAGKSSASGPPKVGEPVIDGQLQALEVINAWNLDADLVTLSACQSGLGASSGGEGVLGFAQAFLTAGARSVCLSLWNVDDAATALLMTRFYQNLLGKRVGLTKPMLKAEALHEAKEWLKNLSLEEANKLTADMGSISRGTRGGNAKLEVIVPKDTNAEKPKKDVRPFAHPRYWAAFILIGDPN